MNLKSKLLTMFGDVKLIHWPLFAYYQPGDYYKVSAIAGVNALSMMQPGDIVLRGYDSYLDGYFIPGKYSHSGLYVGDTFKDTQGSGMMLHAVAEGVSFIHALDFMRCDRFIVLRPSAGQDKAIAIAKTLIGSGYDFNFKSGNTVYYCHEFTAATYPDLNIEPKILTLGWFKFKHLEPRYTADSFLTNANFTQVVKAE